MADPHTAVTLESLYMQLQHFEEIVNLHRTYQQEQVAVAHHILQVKLDEMNKFREENKELTLKFVSREWLDSHLETLANRICALEMNRSNFDGRLLGVASVAGFLIVIFELALHFWKP